VRLDEEDLDEEDLAILAEVAKKGYYHNRPKSVACAPPKKLEESPTPIVQGSAPGAKGRAAYDEFQAKWDCFDSDRYLEAVEETLETKSECKKEQYGLLACKPASRLAVQFKIFLAGEPGVGKSALLQRHRTGEFLRKWTRTPSAEVVHLQFSTDCGEIGFNICELAPSAPDHAFCHGQAAILMYDLSSKASWRNVPTLLKRLRQQCDTIPTVLLGNKADCDTVQRRKLDSLRIPFQKQKQLQYYEMSVQKIENIEKPFLWLARRLTNCPSLQFAKQLASLPEVTLQPELFGDHAELLGRAVALRIEDNSDW